jgi:hypothetical protein
MGKTLHLVLSVLGWGLIKINCAYASICFAFLPLLASDSVPASGSQFAAYVSGMNSQSREQAIQKAVLDGKVPHFLKKLVPVSLGYKHADGTEGKVKVFVMPEYLAVGSDEDYLRVPMNLYTAATIATQLGFVLPTRKIVDAIYQQSAVHFSPEPMQAGPEMRSTAYYQTHNNKIAEQARKLGVKPGDLVSGHKKDVVMTMRLAANPGKIAIYGWQRPNGEPIQPLTTVHGACYADYSHGIRLVSERVEVDGVAKSIYDVLKDPVLSQALSDEGPIPDLRNLLGVKPAASACEKF